MGSNPTLSAIFKGVLIAAGFGLMAALLSGCGFRLQGAVALPAEPSRVAVEGEDRELVQQLANALRARGVEVAEADADDAARVEVDSELSREVLTTDGDGRATAYRLRYAVTMVFTDADGQAQPAQTMVMRRGYEYDPARQLQARAEAEFFLGQMREEAVARILRRLAATPP